VCISFNFFGRRVINQYYIFRNIWVIMYTRKLEFTIYIARIGKNYIKKYQLFIFIIIIAAVFVYYSKHYNSKPRLHKKVDTNNIVQKLRKLKDNRMLWNNKKWKILEDFSQPKRNYKYKYIHPWHLWKIYRKKELAIYIEHIINERLFCINRLGYSFRKIIVLPRLQEINERMKKKLQRLDIRKKNL